MEQWEYLSIFLEADAKDKETKQFIQEKFDKKAKRHSPEAMIPDLNKYGADGWELVHMEPVPKVGGKENIQFDPYRWSATYFCVLKRQIKQPEPVQPIAAQAVEAEPEVDLPPISLDPNRIPY